MPHSLAMLCYGAVIFWLFYQDHRRRPNCSAALWLPVVWLILLGSRPLTFWLGISGGNDLEGSPFDRLVYSGMILLSWIIVARRGLNWGALLGGNKGILVFYLFLGLTILWADYHFVTFKRWIKEVGGMFLILVVLTEQDPIEAIEAVFLRSAYVLLPLSVLFIKYVPDLGRIFDHTGTPQYVGVTLQKNALGEDVLVFSIVILWVVLRRYQGGGWRRLMKTDFAWPLLVLLMGLWLLHISDSKTALICLIIGAVILASNKLPILKNNPRFALTIFLGALPVILALNSAFDISGPILRMLGRDPTFTNRTEIWAVAKEHPVNPLVGCGYLMFWDLNKTVQVGQYDVSLKTIHEGYIEIFLDGGILGLIALFIMLLAIGILVGRAYLRGTFYGRLQLAFFVIMLLYNLSESMYARRGPLWFSFLLFGLDLDSIYYRRYVPLSAGEDSEPDSIRESEIVHSYPVT